MIGLCSLAYYKQLFSFSAQNIENILYSFCTVINDMLISTASFINFIYLLCLLSKRFISSFCFLFILAAAIDGCLCPYLGFPGMS